jgi:hypothetical protein
MYEDPVVAEIHRIREAWLAEFDNDFDALCEDLMQKQDEHEKNGAVVIRQPLPKSSEPLQTSAVGTE